MIDACSKRPDREAGGTVTLVATADLVVTAAETDTAVLAFNVITLEHAEGIADGIERAGVAAVLQISENTIRFHGGRIAPLLAACAQIAEHSSAPLSIHLDHFQDVALINEAIEAAADLGASFDHDRRRTPGIPRQRRADPHVHRARPRGGPVGGGRAR